MPSASLGRTLLLRFNKYSKHLLSIAVIAVAGCGGTPSRPDADAGGVADAETQAGVPGTAGMVEPIDVPEDARLSYERALDAMRRGDVTEAELELEQLTLQHPDFAGPRVNLAIIYMDSGRKEAAQQALERALALNPAHAEAHNQLGIVMRHQGKFVEAEQAYVDALAIAPDYALAHYNLGVLLDLYLKRPEEALPHYERYQALVGNDDQVRKWIIDLRRRLGITEPTSRIAQGETQ